MNNIVIVEVMNFGMKWGFDVWKFVGVINVSIGKCWLSEVNNFVKGVVEIVLVNRDYCGGFGILLMKKDLWLVMFVVKEVGVKMVLVDIVFVVYEDVEKFENCVGRDFLVVYRYLEGKEDWE